MNAACWIRLVITTATVAGLPDRTDAQQTIGPIASGQGPKMVTCYIPARADGTTAANVFVQPSSPSTQQAQFVVRVLDPDERVIYWQAMHRPPGDTAVADVYTEGAGGAPSASADTDDFVAAAALSLPSEGVHQVQVFSSNHVTVKLDLWNNDGYGIAMQPGNYHDWPGQPASMWMLARSHPTSTMYMEFFLDRMAGDDPVLDVFSVVSDAGEIFRAEGFEFDPINAPGVYRGDVIIDEADIAPMATPEVWRVDLPQPPYRFRATGFPLVLCDSQTAAIAIGASILEVPDVPGYAYRGAFVDHAFQVRIADLMPELLAGAGDAQMLYELAEDYPYGGGSNSACYLPPDDNAVVRNYTLTFNQGALVNARWLLGADDSGSTSPTWDDPNQQLDPASVWMGAIGLHHFQTQRCPGGRDRECTAPGATCLPNRLCSIDFDEAVDRWDVMRHLRYIGNTGGTNAFNGLYGGTTLRHYDLPEHVALVAAADNPCNPYFGQREALYRRATGLVLFDLMSLLQGYSYPDMAHSTYSGYPAFQVRNHFAAFERINPDLDGLMPEPAGAGSSDALRDAVRDVWTDAMRCMFDRYWVSHMESARNQTAHYVVAFLSFVRGIDDGNHPAILDTYKDMAFKFAERFKDSADVAGWYGESQGPSPSYEGITHWMMGMALNDMEELNAIHANDAWEETIATEFRTSLVNAYDFHNHFAAVEQDGTTVVAAHNFGHRVADGINNEQFDGAMGIVENEAPIAFWSALHFDPVEFVNLLHSAVMTYDANAANGFPRAGHTSWFEYFDATARPGVLELPHQSMTPGTVRKLPEDGSQAVAIRRGEYYAIFYAGRPALSTFYTNGSDNHVKAAPVTWVDGSRVHVEDDPSGDNHRHLLQMKPMVGGGLSLLWTERFGSAIVGTNWSPLQHHGVVLEKLDPDDDDRFWEDYHAPRTIGDLSTPEADIFEITGALESGYSGTGGYTRRYEFHDDRVVVRIEVNTSHRWVDFHLDRAWENIPLPTTDQTIDCTDCGPWAKPLGSRIVGPDGCILAEGEHELDSFALLDFSGDGISVTITERPSGAPATIIVRPFGLRQVTYSDPQLQVGRVEIPFDDDDYNGLQVLEYEIRPTQLTHCPPDS